jgi:EmrB/QacA subfamily drug resistance transporter
MIFQTRTGTRSLVLLVCCVAQFMVVLDVSIVNVAIPDIVAALRLSASSQQWVVNAYTIAFAGFLMVGGRAGDLFGRRRVFLAGLYLFTVSSLAGGLSPAGVWLPIARGAQGLGGALLAPATLSILTATFADPAARQRAMGAWSATAASGAAIGSLAGGVLTQLLSWRWVLLVNVPLGIVLATLATRQMPPDTAGVRRGQRLDLAGASTVTAGLAVLVYGIVGTATHAWASVHTLVLLAAGVGCLVIFVLIEGRLARAPLVPLTVLRERQLMIANGIGCVIGAAMFGLYYFVSLYLQRVEGYRPLRAGLAFLPAGLATLACAMGAPALVRRLGPRRQLMIGTACGAAGLAWLATIGASTPYLDGLLGPLVLCGAGFGLSVLPMTLAATHGVPADQSGLASALINTSRQLGGALGLALTAAIANAATPNATPAGITHGYQRAWLTVAAFLVLGFCLASVLKRHRDPARARTTGPGSSTAPELTARLVTQTIITHPDGTDEPKINP